MTILDTNVISEAMRERPDRVVLDWMNARPPRSLYATAISEAEIRFGVACLPEGRRRTELMAKLDKTFRKFLAGRVLAFGPEAAVYYGDVRAERRSLGRPMSPFDAQIAAIALCYGAVLATRNTDDFTDCGLVLVNPWD